MLTFDFILLIKTRFSATKPFEALGHARTLLQNCRDFCLISNLLFDIFFRFRRLT